ncbi:MAG: 2-oxoglutarate dehydrogenase E1 component [Leptospirales bacterium]|nr:2-oxoglutarate dehydrogenase E1 component [Leptospirales bacterium]
MAVGILNAGNRELLEGLYEQYLKNPSSVPEAWRKFFSELDHEGTNGNGSNGHAALPLHIPKLSSADMDAVADINMRALLLTQAYRRQGHYSAITDPLGLVKPARYHLSPSDHGLSDSDLDRSVTTMVAGKQVTAPLRELIRRMENTYCSTLGAEFFYIRDEERRGWLIERMEAQENKWPIAPEMRKKLFGKLHDAEYFERFLATRFPGKKRFSLEGGESLIPTLSGLIELAGDYEMQQVVIGMAHRGRLNVLTNVMNKDPALIFAEFNEKVTEEVGPGDVKYHLGYSSDVVTMSGKKVHLSLGFNPSHLEVINPVILGSVRARQTTGNDTKRQLNLPVIIHGDAAFAGQGINYECLQMSNLDGYKIGGAFHIICNNQLGFTTNPADARSTRYCTDLAKMLQVPIFHVNGDDPEACFRAVQLCMEWRRRYGTDVFLDIICYRRWGHNETDEPAFTQPVMYHAVKAHPTTVTLQEQFLLREGFSQEELDTIKTNSRDHFENAYKRSQTEGFGIQIQTLKGNWSGFTRIDASDPVTAVPLDELRAVADMVTRAPTGFSVHPKIQKLLEQRKAMAQPGGRVDWGMGETLAYGTLLRQGTSVRISGQDVKRGTFSHRHAVLFDFQNDDEYMPLSLAGQKAHIEIYNSLLSEAAVLGFEFGYSLADPHTLVIWEAQFGDFANGAQVIIDQFISSCEAKWQRMSGLVMLLPHGYEGQGPEHSSARLERYLQLCSLNNIIVANCTTPAQYFHMIRRQMLRNYRKPLVIMSPKSLLRLPEATSTLEEFSRGTFDPVLEETDSTIVPEKVRRILFCSGKIYYELAAERKKLGCTDVAIVRVEELYPYPVKEIADVIQSYPQATEVAWVQEEPRNQGAWTYMEDRLRSQIAAKQELQYLGRTPSPSPATGYFKVHQKEQQEILDQAFEKGE